MENFYAAAEMSTFNTAKMRNFIQIVASLEVFVV